MSTKEVEASVTKEVAVGEGAPVEWYVFILCINFLVAPRYENKIYKQILSQLYNLVFIIIGKNMIRIKLKSIQNKMIKQLKFDY